MKQETFLKKNHFVPLNQRQRSANNSSRSGIWDSIVIGGGPAGLAAGIYLARMGFKTLLTEAQNLGGQARQLGRIENYPGFPNGVSGKMLTERLIKQGQRWGLEIRQAKITRLHRQKNILIASTGKSPTPTKSIIISTGAAFKKLGVAREDHFSNKGLFYGFVDDGERWRHQKIVIVGGGDSSYYQALELARHAKEINIICRSAPKAARHLISQVHHWPNIRVHHPGEVTSLVGSSKLRAVIIKKPAESLVIEADALFVLIGKLTNKSLWSTLKHRQGIFWAGDSHNGLYRQVAIATGDGIRAAMDCARYIQSWLC